MHIARRRVYALTRIYGTVTYISLKQKFSFYAKEHEKFICKKQKGSVSYRKTRWTEASH